MTAIVTLTMNPALDIATATETVVPGHKLRCREPRYDPGGGGINVARAVHQLGGDALAVFPVGGLAGEMLRRLLLEEGVPHIPIPIAGMTRESLAVVEQQSGKQYRFLLPGPRLTSHEQERCLEALAMHAAGAPYLIASGSLPPGVPANFYARVRTLAAKCGARFVLDTSGPALAGAGTGMFLIKASLRELAELAGHSVESREAAGGAGRARDDCTGPRRDLDRVAGRAGRAARDVTGHAAFRGHPGRGDEQRRGGRQHGRRHRARSGARMETGRCGEIRHGRRRRRAAPARHRALQP